MLAFQISVPYEGLARSGCVARSLYRARRQREDNSVLRFVADHLKRP